MPPCGKRDWFFVFENTQHRRSGKPWKWAECGGVLHMNQMKVPSMAERRTARCNKTASSLVGLQPNRAHTNPSAATSGRTRGTAVQLDRWRHAGHSPPVSNVFQMCPQAQDQRSSLRGDQPQSGQRMRGGSETPGLFSSSSSRSGTMTGLSVTGLIRAIMTYPCARSVRVR